MKKKQLLKELCEAVDGNNEFAWQFGAENEIIITLKV